MQGKREAEIQDNDGLGRANRRIDRYIFIAALYIIFLPMMSGCLESSFSLASGSRLPKWVTLPHGVDRTDISITLRYYSLRFYDAKVIMTDREGRTIWRADGKTKCHTSLTSYPNYEVVVVNGVTEVVEHKRMEPEFYVTDDPTLRRMLPCL